MKQLDNLTIVILPTYPHLLYKILNIRGVFSLLEFKLGENQSCLQFIYTVLFLSIITKDLRHEHL